MSEAELLEAVINTLNNISVKGKDNLDKLLSCILVLEGMRERGTADGEPDTENNS